MHLSEAGLAAPGQVHERIRDANSEDAPGLDPHQHQVRDATAHRLLLVATPA